MTRLCALLVAVGTAAHAETALVSMNPLAAGESAFTATAGRPLAQLRFDHGLFDWLDAGLQLDGAWKKFFRPGIGTRARLVRRGCSGVNAKADLALVKPLRHSYGPRPIMSAGDGELGLQAHLAFGDYCSFGLSAQVSAMIDTDLSSMHTGVFLHSTGGLEWAPFHPVSLLARAGELRGFNGSRAVVSGGAAIRF